LFQTLIKTHITRSFNHHKQTAVLLIWGGDGTLNKTHAFGVRDPGSNPL